MNRTNGSLRPSNGEIPASATTPTTESIAAAACAGLEWVNDAMPGITRKRSGRGFFFLDAEGKAIHDETLLTQIRRLAIPPAWTSVWICPEENGHLQATGKDARGRKQYLYHPQWRAVRDQTKYEKCLEFGRTLPEIRRRVEEDLSGRGLSRNRVLAAVVRLLDVTAIRVGNDEYARTNDSFGLTTMRDEHVEFDGSCMFFRFRGKSGIDHRISFCDARLSRLVAKCQELPGQELFAYLDDEGKPRDVTSSEVNAYLREVSGREFTAKDFRTWSGTAAAAAALLRFPQFTSKAEAKRNVNQAIDLVAEKLGNTRAVCRKCYIHPAVIEAYNDRTLVPSLERLLSRQSATAGLSPHESAVLAFLEERLDRGGRNAKRSRRTRRQSSAA